MSEIEFKKGKLKPTGKDIENYMSGLIVPDYCETVKEAFDDMFYMKAYFMNGQVYEVECVYEEHDDIFESSKSDDGTIDFTVRYYNGGCSFNEALDCATKQIK